jgi:hypothetical protein
VHDRTIEGKTFVFGNAGGLYKNAMTWWDHETFSIWSQPTGEALAGPLEGTRLDPLPFQLTIWENWLSAHPETLVMNNQASRMGAFRQRFSDDFLIGVTVADLARGYPFWIAAEERLIQDMLGDFPILVWAADQDYRVFLRQVDDQVLTFRWDNGNLVDDQTGSVWDPRLGLARQGEYQGQALQQLPSFSIFESSWDDFYPEGDIYQSE